MWAIGGPLENHDQQCSLIIWTFGRGTSAARVKPVTSAFGRGAGKRVNSAFGRGATYVGVSPTQACSAPVEPRCLAARAAQREKLDDVEPLACEQSGRGATQRGERRDPRAVEGPRLGGPPMQN